jgi:hypothetical protein
MEAEHKELSWVAKDKTALAALVTIRNFTITSEVKTAYQHLRAQYKATNPETIRNQKESELAIVAQHEQLNVLQPLIYEDPKLKITMDINHKFSRFTVGLLSPEFKVVFSFNPLIEDKALQAKFDVPNGMRDRYLGDRKSLPNPKDRMKFVAEIATMFNGLMQDKLPYMEGELRKIRGWLSA